jgi:carbonic anhydrase
MNPTIKRLLTIAATSTIALYGPVTHGAESLSIPKSTAAPSYVTQTKESQAKLSPRDALELLRAGNQRFVSGVALRRDLTAQVHSTASGQYPFAAILSCMDSRVSPELVFDQGLGDIFGLRVAGNVVDEDIVGSLEYAAKAVGVKVIAVLGHTYCGAVKGACDDVQLGSVTALVRKIQPARDAVTTSPGVDRSSHNLEFVNRVAEEHVRRCLDDIRQRSELIRELEKQGKLVLVGGMYDLQTGSVRFNP